MKKFLLAVMMAVGAVAWAADPNPFSDYGAAMKSTEEHPLAVNWSKAHDAEIAAATTEDVLAEFVEDVESATGLLAKLKPAYETDPIVMIQIAAVTQWVMLPDPCFLFFWKPFPSSGRVVWMAALSKKISETQDEYVRTFCQQQLDLCADLNIVIRK